MPMRFRAKPHICSSTDHNTSSIYKTSQPLAMVSFTNCVTSYFLLSSLFRGIVHLISLATSQQSPSAPKFAIKVCARNQLPTDTVAAKSKKRLFGSDIRVSFVFKKRKLAYFTFCDTCRSIFPLSIHHI